MARTFHVEVVTPDATALSTEAVALQAPAWEGYLGVLAGHAPLLTVLRPGVLIVRTELVPKQRVDGLPSPQSEATKTDYFAVKGGFMEVMPDRVVVLADAVERADAIDAGAASRDREEAKAPPEPPSGDTIEARTKAREEAQEARAEKAKWAEARLHAVERQRAGS